ncbi:hypothetical protein AB433_00610 [Croceicoccus naphthovorans]|uniref:Peptidase A2 domain-containing protein n=1 Tax=Croceicoccus naphthovorans TaxID=1348774 RepID=A0A0G3XIJ0_9SPHN|nr:hypothetical protein AB433_00610 [Croceicoccus naphthovorans]
MVTLLFAAPPGFARSESYPEPDDSPESQSETLEAEQKSDRLTLDVGIGSHGPFDFIVDTGSEATVVSSRVVDALGMQTGEPQTVIGVAGKAMRKSVVLDSLLVGSLRIEGLPAAVMEEADIGAAGIIGIGSLKDQRLVLDFEKRRITVSASRARMRAMSNDNEIVVTAKRRNNRLIVKRATLDGRHIDVVIDTGSTVTIGNRELRRRFYAKAPVLATTELTDVLGNRQQVALIAVKNLTIGPVGFAQTAIAIADTAIFEELGLTERPALLLGMNHLKLFRRVAVDFRHRQIAFELPEEQG